MMTIEVEISTGHQISTFNGEIEQVAENGRPHCICGAASPLHLAGCPKLPDVYAELVTA